jgi:E3 ubiquitin-protein ligase CCNP1IP1
MLTEHETMRRKYDELAHMHAEKAKKLLRVQEQYDKAKRKAELGHIQRAASDAVDLTVKQVNQQALNSAEQRDIENERPHIPPSLFQNSRFDTASGMNTGQARAHLTRIVNESRWPRPGFPCSCKNLFFYCTVRD